MIAGVTVWTLRAHISAIYVGGIIELTVWTKIVALDQKWTAASFAIVWCAFESNTVKTGRAAIAFRAHGVVFAGLSNKDNKLILNSNTCRLKEKHRWALLRFLVEKLGEENDEINKLSESSLERINFCVLKLKQV